MEYDRSTCALVQLLRFANEQSADANCARLDLELRQMKSGVSHEIVILGAASEKHLRRTHRRYFEPIQTLADPEASIFMAKAA